MFDELLIKDIDKQKKINSIQILSIISWSV